MSAFGTYGRWYDLFYRDKDYAGEAAFVQGLLAGLGAGEGPVLELGCGTGGHAVPLALAGREVLGVDASRSMLDAFERVRSTQEPDVAARLSCRLADARDLDLGRTFPAVISLFHVMNYFTDESSLARVLDGAARHLAPGGALVFDAWHGPAVLAQGPEERVRVERDGEITVTRRAVPTHLPDRDMVDVRFEFTVTGPGVDEQFSETHRMRYLFPDDVFRLLRAAGLEPAGHGQWLTGREPDESCWSVHYAAVRPEGR